MSDLSSPEEIRAEVIDVLAAAQRAIDIGHYPHMSDGTPRPTWEGCTDRRRDMYRKAAAPFADALAAAGLLPIEIRCAAVHHDFQYFENLEQEDITTREAAVKELASWRGGGRLVGYYRTDWFEVSE